MANTFIRLDGSICIGDFGLSKSFNSDLTAEPSWISFDVDCDSDGGSFQVPTTPRDYTREQVGTPTFMAPEVHAGEKYSYEADTWSLGVTLYRLMISRVSNNFSVRTWHCSDSKSDAFRRRRQERCRSGGEHMV